MKAGRLKRHDCKSQTCRALGNQKTTQHMRAKLQMILAETLEYTKSNDAAEIKNQTTPYR